MQPCLNAILQPDTVNEVSIHGDRRHIGNKIDKNKNTQKTQKHLTQQNIRSVPAQGFRPIYLRLSLPEVDGRLSAGGAAEFRRKFNAYQVVKLH